MTTVGNEHDLSTFLRETGKDRGELVVKDQSSPRLAAGRRTSIDRDDRRIILVTRVPNFHFAFFVLDLKICQGCLVLIFRTIIGKQGSVTGIIEDEKIAPAHFCLICK